MEGQGFVYKVKVIYKHKKILEKCQKCYCQIIVCADLVREDHSLDTFSLS